MNTRGYVIESDDSEESDLKAKIREEMINKLASEWNDANNRREARSFRSEEEVESEDEYLAERAEELGYQAYSDAEESGKSKEECELAKTKAQDFFYQEVDKKKNEATLRLEVIEELLGELGARMMRPYEHWNEDEKYMEYMETRYDNEYY